MIYPRQTRKRLHEIQGGYYGQLDTPSGGFVFGIHPKRKDAPKQCQANISVVFKVKDLAASLLLLKQKGLLPEEIEQDEQGKFAHFHDPDGNKVSLWEK
jgi:predicted enzyme related to lactoylglutathione lyase